MNRLTRANLTLVGVTAAIVLGIGCGGGGGLGGGCAGAGGGPLPNSPGPWGLPMSQAIEGGGQVRITRPGFDKLSALIPALAGMALPSMAMPQCLGPQSQSLSLLGTGVDFSECGKQCGGGGPGCPAWVDLRPDLAPPSGVALKMDDNPSKAVVDVDAAFDVHMVVPIQYRLCGFGFCGNWNDVCDLHLDAPGTHLNAGIVLDVDPQTGVLTIALDSLNLVDLNLNLANCGFASDLYNLVAPYINALASSFVGNAIIGVLRPQLNQLLQGFLPNPPGLATKISTATLLASYDPPKEAALETLMLAGGYVAAKSGGLNIGLITGMNSDRDATTRDPLKVSEASLCVPQRPAVDLAGAPWLLPRAAARPDRFALAPANEFSGMPDPADVMGHIQDVAIGISRTFLDVAGFHIYNSGTLCLSVSGPSLAALNAGAIGVLVPSLSNILADRKAPMAIRLRPEQPLRFTLGAGSAADPLVKIRISDLRIDFYVYMEERFVRLFTLGLDAHVGLNLAVTMLMDGHPGIAPMITGIDKTNVTVQVMNTDLLQEDPEKLAKSLLGLIDVAVGQLAGGLQPIALPALMGFTLDQLALQRVQTKEDDFLGIFGNLVADPNAILWPLPKDTVPRPRPLAPTDTSARILDVTTPPPDVIQAAAIAGQLGGGGTPTVTLALGGSAEHLEWSYRVNGGGWHPWSTDARPTIADAAFLLQGKHTIDVRARVQGDWTTEDQTPERLDFVIDSVPPELAFHSDHDGGHESGQDRISFTAWDNVTDTGAIRYAWQTPAGMTEPVPRAWITLDEARAASDQGRRPVTVRAVDESGNYRDVPLPLAWIGTPVAQSTWGCAVRPAERRGAGDATWALALLPLLGLAIRRSLRRA